jgi:hypothetical protein
VREAVGRWVDELIGEMCGLLRFGWLGEFSKCSVLGIGVRTLSWVWKLELETKCCFCEMRIEK